MGTGTNSQQQFSVELRDDYIHLRTWGALDMTKLDEPANAALQMSQKFGVDKLLDDIRDVDTSAVSIPMQAKSMSILWKLRAFKRVAIILKPGRVQNLFLSTVQTIGLNQSRFRAFEEEVDAIAWLQDTPKDTSVS